MFEFASMVSAVDTESVDYMNGKDCKQTGGSITECPKYGVLQDRTAWICGWLDAERLDASEQIA